MTKKKKFEAGDAVVLLDDIDITHTSNLVRYRLQRNNIIVNSKNIDMFVDAVTRLNEFAFSESRMFMSKRDEIIERGSIGLVVGYSATAPESNVFGRQHRNAIQSHGTSIF